MRVAFISDIHGNAVALESVLEDIESKKVDEVIILGDICFRGSEPKRSLDLVRSIEANVIKGNADEWLVRGIKQGEVPDLALEKMRIELKWTLEKLSKDDLDYLNNLPEQITYNITEQLEIHAFHATPNSLFEAISPYDSDEIIQTKLMDKNTADIFLYGHIHFPYMRFINGKCIANLGSVGLPFDGMNRASYLIVEGEGKQFSLGIQRVEYDIEKVVNQLNEFDYPNLDLLVNMIRNGSK